MKRILSLLAIITFLCGAAAADDFSLVFSASESHPDILWDTIPTYMRLGVNYSGIDIFPGKTTELGVFGGGGYGYTETWTDLDGIPLDPGVIDVNSESLTDRRNYNSWRADWALRMQQYLIPLLVIPVGDISLYLEYQGTWMTPLDHEGVSFGLDGIDSAYPDKNGLLTNGIGVGTVWNALVHGAAPSGFGIEAALSLLPEVLGNTALGRCDYIRLAVYAVGYLPLFVARQQKRPELNLFAIHLANRVALDAVWGNAVPLRTRMPIALGSKMRGFEKYSYGSTYTFVNNFEARFTGPELFLKNIYPRVHLFLDVGAFWGDYINTGVGRSGFLASAGIEASLTFLDLFSVGYRLPFVLAGENMARTLIAGDWMFSLQFE